MITAELQGKVGNMMFQIAAIEDMGRRSGLQTAYPHVDENIDALKKPQACSSEFNGQKYFGMFKNFDWHKNLSGDTHADREVHVPFEYLQFHPRDYTCYIGYFQSELYFQDREFILNLFEPALYIQEALEEYRDVIGVNKAAIHVRRGDYIKLNHIYKVLDIDYYSFAMRMLRTIGVKEYLVFSNDTEWCKENFKGDQFTFIKDDNLVELFLMSQCAHNIIANSAFSWWGAWLNSNPSRRVIAPKTWFTSSTPDSRDIIPQSWTKI
jgi:hypothetical protein